MNKIYVVTVVDCGDSCDGRARVLGAFRNEEDAKNYVINDMEDRVDQLAGACESVDFDEMSVICDDDICSLWNIEAIEIQ